MKIEKLDSLLTEMGKRPVPALPPRFKQNVWTEIQRRQERQKSESGGWLEDLLLSFMKPRPVFASIAIALAVGVAGTLSLSESHESPNASSALSLDVFAPRTQIMGMWPGGAAK